MSKSLKTITTILLLLFVLIGILGCEANSSTETDEEFLHYFKEPGVYKSIDYSYFDKDGWIRKP